MYLDNLLDNKNLLQHDKDKLKKFLNENSLEDNLENCLDDLVYEIKNGGTKNTVTLLEAEIRDLEAANEGLMNNISDLEAEIMNLRNSGE